MKIITYNLHKGRGRGRRSILEEAVHAIAGRKPDLLLCQEVFHSAEDQVHQAPFITEILGHGHVFGPNSFYRAGCHGNATFARLPVDEHVNVDVSESFFEKRGILHARLDDGGRPLEVLNVHFSLTGRQRRRQWSRLLECLPGDASVPVVACGDFNDWAGGLDLRARRSGVLRNALWDLPVRQRRTFPARRPLFPLDRVYVRGFRAVEVRVLTGEPWSGLSDHLPVEVVLERE